LLHDIGKAVDQEFEGHHSVLGANVCAKHNESSDIVDAIRLHHTDDLTFASPLAVILNASNSLSENRPGARKEMLETYVKRLQDLEEIAKSYNGVTSAFVMQAGRDVRAIVDPSQVSDEEALNLSSDLASRLRKELTFPGQVRITILRESRAVDFAK
jgi:ribonuclease Y